MIFLKIILLVGVKYKGLLNYVMEETTKFSTKCPSEGGELDIQIAINDSMISKNDDRELQYSGRNVSK